MSDSPLAKIELSDLVDQLRIELKVLSDLAKGEDFVFEVEGADIELQTVVTKEAEGKAGVKFWVIEASAGAKYSSAATQTIRLRLKPTDRRPGAPAKTFINAPDGVAPQPLTQD